MADSVLPSSPQFRSSPQSWPVVDPHVTRIAATAEDVDEFGHVNNVRYAAWAMDAAWAHSNSLGMTFDDYRRIGVGCVVLRHEFEYRRPVVEGELVDCATWIEANDGRLRLVRAFEMKLASEDVTVFRGRTTFVSIDMASGKPARMPAAFVEGYAPAMKKE